MTPSGANIFISQTPNPTQFQSMWARGSKVPQVASLSVKCLKGRTALALCSRIRAQEFQKSHPSISYHVPTRPFSLCSVNYKGHNKWSNIKHIKGARDAEIAKKNYLFRNRILLAIKTNGNNTNPDSNISLRKVLDEAKSQMVRVGLTTKARLNHSL